MSAPERTAAIVLDLDARTARLEMQDADGRVITYALDPAHADGEFALAVSRHDREAGPYRTCKRKGRLWHCTCESFKYRSGPFAPYGCKHSVTAAVLKAAVLDHLTPDPETLPMAKKTTDAPSPHQTPAAPPADAPAVQAAPQAAEVMRRRLAEPFPPAAIGWKPTNVSGSRCMALAYIDARDVQDRLDEVCGVDGWRPEFVENADGTVRCTLHLRMPDGSWLPKGDVGGESEQKDPGDRKKAAYSDAMKRAAVHWGVGRYLYSLPTVWADYDPQRKQITQTPPLPAWALPGGTGRPPGTQTAAPQAAAKAAPPFTQTLQAWDEKAVAQGACRAGELVEHVVAKGRAGGFAADADRWSAAEVKQARAWAGEFVAERRPAKAS